MICNWCREKQHDNCVNDWEQGILVKRDTPIKSCACQHRVSWNFSKTGETEENEGNNGDGS